MEYYYIYLLGYLICYVILKELRNLENSNEWSDVKLTFILSLTSLVGVLVYGLTLILRYKDSNKPPRFL